MYCRLGNLVEIYLKGSHRMMEPKVENAQNAFRTDRSIAEKNSLSNKFSRNLESIPKSSMLGLSTSRKHLAASLHEDFVTQ